MNGGGGGGGYACQYQKLAIVCFKYTIYFQAQQITTKKTEKCVQSALYRIQAECMVYDSGMEKKTNRYYVTGKINDVTTGKR